MRDLKIGALTFKPTAIKRIALCLFLNGMLIGLMVAYKKYTGDSVSLFIIYPLMFLPYLLNRKTIRRNMLEKILFTLSIAAVMTSCGSSSDKQTDNEDTTEVTPTPTVTEQPATSTETFKEFDWSSVPQSTTEIGAFPYLTAPAGFFIQGKGGSDESTTGYSELKDFNKLIMFNGQSFYNAEGKVAKLKFSMKDKEADWNQYSFDSSVDKYLQSIGAKLLGKLQINNAQKEFLNKEDDMAIYNHIVGDPYNEPVRFYALNHSKTKIMFQVFSNSASGEIAVVELAPFEQTMKAPTASPTN